MTDEQTQEDKQDNSLEARIKKARIQSSLDTDENGEQPKGAQAGSEFLALAISGALLGYGVDWLLSSQPWGMIFMILMGFVAGVYRANATMKKNNEVHKK